MFLSNSSLFSLSDLFTLSPYLTHQKDDNLSCFLSIYLNLSLSPSPFFSLSDCMCVLLFPKIILTFHSLSHTFSLSLSLTNFLLLKRMDVSDAIRA